MTQPDSPPVPSPQPHYDDEIDLSQYLDVLIAWWKEILLIAFATAAVAVTAGFALQAMLAPEYAAIADVVIARIASEITLDERVQTVQDDFNEEGATTDSHRAALVALAGSGELAAAVADELGGQLSEEQSDPSALRDMVKVSLPPVEGKRTSSDLIRIEATADSPDLASMIANSWASQFVRKINNVYGQVPPDLLDSLQTELVAADKEYQIAQRNLEAYIADSQIDTLSRQIADREQMRTSLQEGHAQALALVANEDQRARRNLLVALTSAQLNAHLDVFTEQFQARTQDLEQLYYARSAAKRHLDQAQNLQSQIDSAGEAATNTNAIAVQLLKAQVFSSLQSPIVSPVQIHSDSAPSLALGTESRLPANLTINAEEFGHANAEEQLQDVAALVAILEQYVQDIELHIVETSETLLSGDGYTALDSLDAGSLGISGNMATEDYQAGQDTGDSVNAAILRNYESLFDFGQLLELSQTSALQGSEDSLQTQMRQLDRSIQALRSQLSTEQARSRQLTQQRDLAWNTFDALSNQAAELSMQLSSANRQVRIGSLAVPPTEPIDELSMPTIAGLAFAFGLLLGVFVAFLSNYMGHQPFLSRRPQLA